MDIDIYDPATKTSRTVTVPDLVYDFRVKGEDPFVDISTLTLDELRSLLPQYAVYRVYHQMIIERMDVLMAQGHR